MSLFTNQVSASMIDTVHYFEGCGGFAKCKKAFQCYTVAVTS